MASLYDSPIDAYRFLLLVRQNTALPISQKTLPEVLLGFPPAGCPRSPRQHPAAERDSFRRDMLIARHHSHGAGSDLRDSRGTMTEHVPEIIARSWRCSSARRLVRNDKGINR